MKFKEWLLKEIGGNGPMGEPPQQKTDIFMKAMPGIFNRCDDPPRCPKSPLKRFVDPKRR